MENKGGSAGVGFGGFGSMLAITISWSVEHSILWMILHGIISWLYVIYYAINLAETHVPLYELLEERLDVLRAMGDTHGASKERWDSLKGLNSALLRRRTMTKGEPDRGQAEAAKTGT